jgi:hypothetical protein
VLLVGGACHGVLLAVSLWLYPVQRRVDTAGWQNGIFRGQFNAAVNGALESRFRDGAQLIVVGSSDAMLGFRPDEVEALMPGVRVHSLATGSLRMDEIRQLVQLAWSVMPVEQRPRTRFVATLVFPSFPGPRSPYVRREDGVAQRIRGSGEFRETDGVFEPRWTGSLLAAATAVRRPLALVDAWADDLSADTFGMQQFVSAALAGGTPDVHLVWRTRPREQLLFPRADTAEGRAVNVQFFRGVMGDETLGDAQFDELRRLCAWARVHGARLTLVGMPVPGWLRSALPYDAEYRARLAPIVDGLSADAPVGYVDLHDADLPMWDATHPVPGTSRVWASALVERLRAAGEPPGAEAGTR